MVCENTWGRQLRRPKENQERGISALMVQSSSLGLQFQHDSEGRQAPEDDLEIPSLREYAAVTAASHLAATFHCPPRAHKRTLVGTCLPHRRRTGQNEAFVQLVTMQALQRLAVCGWES